MTLGKRILERRKALEMTQQDLAQALGITSQHVSLIEQGKSAPSLTLLGGLAKELGTTTDYLISGEEGKVVDVISAIKAEKRLSIKTKKALIALVQESYDHQLLFDSSQVKEMPNSSQRGSS